MTRKTAYILFLCLALLMLVNSTESIDPYLIPRFLAFAFFSLIGSVIFFQQKKVFSLHAFHWILLLLIAYSALTVFWAINTPDALLETFHLMVALLFSILLSASFKESPDENVLLKILLTTTFLAELFAFYTLYNLYRTRFETFQGIYSITGNMAHKNLLCCFFATTLPFSLWALYRLKSNWKYFSSLVIGFALFFILLLQSRSLWLALAGVSLLIICTLSFLKLWSIVLQKTRRIIWPSLFSLCITLLLLGFVWATKPFVFDEGTDHIQSIVEQSKQDKSAHMQSIYERYFLWDNTVKMIKEHWIKGVGAGSWKFLFPKYGVSGSRAEEGFTVFQRPHNDFLWVLSEYGIIGIGLLFALIVFIVYQAIKTLRTTKNTGIQLKIILLSSTLFIFFVDSIFSFPKERSELIMVSLLTITWLLHVCQVKEKSYSNKWFIVASGLLSIICFAYYHRLQGEKISYKMIVEHSQGRFNKLPALAEKAESFIYNTDPFLSPVCWYAGINYYNKGLQKEAVETFSKAVKIHPYHLHSLNNLAGSYVQIGNNKLAEKYYLEALKISPFYDEALINLSAIYYNDKNYQQALWAIKKCPKNSKHPNYKKNAIAIYKKVLGGKMSQENPDTLFELFQQSIGK